MPSAREQICFDPMIRTCYGHNYWIFEVTGMKCNDRFCFYITKLLITQLQLMSDIAAERHCVEHCQQRPVAESQKACHRVT